MRISVIIIVVHQVIFQGMFFAKNILLRRKLGVPIRGTNPEAAMLIIFIALFIFMSILLSLIDVPFGTFNIVKKPVALIVSLILLFVNLLIGTASLIGLKDSWRPGVLEDQQADLIDEGIYGISRNPYFLSYIILFLAYTILLQNIILFILSIVGFAMIHLMVLKEERHLKALHGQKYSQYKKKVPRYFII